jgi:cell division protein FtsB
MNNELDRKETTKMEMPAWLLVQGLTTLESVADYIILLQKQAVSAEQREKRLEREIAELKANVKGERHE